VERLVAQIWAEVLGLAAVGRDVDFFALGGDSLAANRMIAVVGRAVGRRVPVREFLLAPTVAGLARTLSGHEEVIGTGATGGTAGPGELGSEVFVLTAAQQQLWFLEQLAPFATSYHVPLAVWVAGELDHARLRHAFEVVVARHDALRQVFLERHGEPAVEIRDTAAVPLTCAVAADEKAALALARAFVARPFIPGEVRLRAAIFATQGPQLLVLVLHHLICDGASLWLLLDELAAYCDASAKRQIPGPAPGFVAFARAQARSTSARRRQAAALARELAGFPHVVSILGARSPAESRRYVGDIVTVEVPSHVAMAARMLAARSGVSVAAVTFAAYAATLEVATGMSRFLVSVPVANRVGVDELRTVGFMVNSV